MHIPTNSKCGTPGCLKIHNAHMYCKYISTYFSRLLAGQSNNNHLQELQRGPQCWEVPQGPQTHSEREREHLSSSCPQSSKPFTRRSFKWPLSYCPNVLPSPCLDPPRKQTQLGEKETCQVGEKVGLRAHRQGGKPYLSVRIEEIVNVLCEAFVLLWLRLSLQFKVDLQIFIYF